LNRGKKPGKSSLDLKRAMMATAVREKR